MAFRFSLQTLLRLRQAHERQERLRLEILSSDRVQAQTQLEIAARERLSARESLAAQLATGLTGSELHFEVACDAARARFERAMTERLKRLTEQRYLQLLTYQKARQKREILDNLRARKMEFYRLIQSRREQQRLDDVFLLHRNEPGSR